MKFLLAALALFLPFSHLQADTTKPNIILILVDDFGRELIGALGGESYPTPNIDGLARDGMTFEICYATPMCSPTRNMLLSGKYNFRNYTNWGDYWFDSQPTIANSLSAAGYDTAMAGKWHLGGWDQKPYGPTRAGFQQYATFDYPEMGEEERQLKANFYWNTNLWENGERNRLEGKYSPRKFREFHLSAIRAHENDDTPFFLYYPMILCHRPFVPTDLVETEGVYHPKGKLENFPDMVAFVDANVGAIRQALQETGQAKNTLIIFTADNGTDNVSHAKELRSQWRGQMLPGGKYLPTEMGANIPLFAVWPDTIEPGSHYSKPVDLTDIHPTLCHLAGATAPDGLDGYDLTPVLKGEGDSARRVAYTWGVFEHSSKKYKTPIEYKDELLHIVRDERYKYQSDGVLYDLKEGWPQGAPVPDGQLPEIRDRLRKELESIRRSEPRLW